MKLVVELDEADLKRLVIAELSRLVEFDLEERDVTIEVKSTQNWKSEWENAAFRARVNKGVP